MTALAAEHDRTLASFRSFAATLEQAGPDWHAEVREAAIVRFAELGYPTRKREDWKYTNSAPIARAEFETASAVEAGATHAELEAAVGAAALERALVFVDGRLAPELSSPVVLPDGAVVDGLANVLRERPELARPHLMDPTTIGDRCFAALNAAFQRDGAFVSLPRGLVLEEPIELVFATTSGAGNRTSHLRNVITLAESSAAVVVERYVALGDADTLTNAFTAAALAANARLDHVSLERESGQALHVGTLFATIGRDASFRSHAVSLGALLARNEVVATLAAEGAECELNGLFLADGRQHVDNQTTIDHAAPLGTSRELYKGVLSGRSKGVFNGKVIVRQGAQKTDAQQSNSNLLLSEGAQVNTRPNLEIFADDVKCTHGSTVGRLDDDALFFLQARGIGGREARQMLSRAFASELIEAIPWQPLRDEIGRHVARKLGDALEGT